MASAGSWVRAACDLLMLFWSTSLAATYAPVGLGVATDRLEWPARRINYTGVVFKGREAWRRSSGKEGSQEKDSTIEEWRERPMRVAFEGVAEDAQGMVQGAQLLTGHSKFDFGGMQHDKLQLWHETRDQQSPIHTVWGMAERSCDLHYRLCVTCLVTTRKS